jgi:hypothetical protein
VSSHERNANLTLANRAINRIVTADCSQKTSSIRDMMSARKRKRLARIRTFYPLKIHPLDQIRRGRESREDEENRQVFLLAEQRGERIQTGA